MPSDFDRAYPPPWDPGYRGGAPSKEALDEAKQDAKTTVEKLGRNYRKADLERNIGKVPAYLEQVFASGGQIKAPREAEARKWYIEYLKKKGEMQRVQEKTLGPVVEEGPKGAMGGGVKAYASGHFNVAAPLLEQTFHKNPNAATALMAAMAHQRNGNEERAQKLHMQALLHHEAGQGQLTPAQVEHARENANPDHLVHFDNKVSVQNAIKNMATKMETQGVHPQEAIRMATSQVFDHLGSGPIVQGIQAMKPLYNEPMNIMAEPRAGAQGPIANPPETFVHYGAPIPGPNPDAMQITARRPMVSAPSPGIQEVAPRTMNNPPGHVPITAPHAARIYNEDK